MSNVKDDELDALLDELQKPPEEPKPAETNEITAVVVEKPPRTKEDQLDPDQTKARLSATLAEFDNVSTEILDAWRNDRKQTQDVIDLLFQQVQSGVEELPRVVLESLVQAMAVKTNASLIAAKLLDSKVKLIQTAKSGIFIQNNNSIASPQGELQQLLEQPVENDLE